MAAASMPLLQARGTNGTLTITADTITTTAPGGMRSQSVERSNVTRIEHGVAAIRLFGMGGMMWFKFYTADGHHLQADGIPWRQAQQVKLIFGLA